jgi:hypothetical protein
MSDVEQTGNSELAGLMLQAHGVDGELAANAPEAIQQAQELAAVGSLAQENTQGVEMILATAVPVLGKLYPSLVAVYTPDACAAVAMSLGPVLAKYGINLKEWGGKYQEEIGALFVCGPIAWATVQGIKADIAERAGAPKALEQGKPAPAIGAPEAGKNLKPGDYGYVETQAARRQAHQDNDSSPGGLLVAKVDSMTEFPGA